MDNRKTRTVSLIQPTVLVFLVILSKHCFMEPSVFRGIFFYISDRNVALDDGGYLQRKKQL